MSIMTETEQAEADAELRAGLEKALTMIAKAWEEDIAKASDDLQTDIEGLRETVAELAERVEELEAVQ